MREYAKISNKDIEDTLKSEMSGDLLRGMLAISQFLLCESRRWKLIMRLSYNMCSEVVLYDL